MLQGWFEDLPIGFHFDDEGEVIPHLSPPPSIQCVDCGSVRRPWMMTRISLERRIKTEDNKFFFRWRCPKCHKKAREELFAQIELDGIDEENENAFEKWFEQEGN